MQDFDNDIANHTDIHTVLISDLHLSQDEPVLTQAFLHFLNKINQLQQLQNLYILGDWFDTWLGDDVADTPDFANWLQPILEKLQNLNQNGCQIFIMHGNRDFLLGQKFCDRFGGKLLKQPYFIQLSGQKIRLEHGDKLCTDDKNYQRFRKIIQNPFSKAMLLACPLSQRAKIAQNLRQKSKTDNQKKSLQIMDVNPKAVQNALKNCDVLIHGHTHRPFVHDYDNKKRLVLGDWRAITHQQQRVEAVVGIAGKHLELCMFHY